VWVHVLVRANRKIRARRIFFSHFMNTRVLLFVPLLLVAAALGWANRPEAHPLAPGATADRVVVHKGRRTPALLRRGTVLKTYPVALGGAPAGHKRQEGDERTPEGVYRLDRRNPNSAAHRSLHVSYPDSADGCIAVTHREMDEIWRAVPVGTPIEIRP
jgi:L,D-peptidoglycan transpeptidase YkuD (ErfK/YbiS/YcfS/YnhG family)